eukprot:8003445-Prorocentrum_lima.AAC.1
MRRVRSRPPVGQDPVQEPSAGPVEAAYVALSRREMVLKQQLARVAQQKRALEMYLYEPGGEAEPRMHSP